MYKKTRCNRNKKRKYYLKKCYTKELCKIVTKIQYNTEKQKKKKLTIIIKMYWTTLSRYIISIYSIFSFFDIII